MQQPSSNRPSIESWEPKYDQDKQYEQPLVWHKELIPQIHIPYALGNGCLRSEEANQFLTP